jgi:hypothetical protein
MGQPNCSTVIVINFALLAMIFLGVAAAGGRWSVSTITDELGNALYTATWGLGSVSFNNQGVITTLSYPNLAPFLPASPYFSILQTGGAVVSAFIGIGIFFNFISLISCLAMYPLRKGQALWKFQQIWIMLNLFFTALPFTLWLSVCTFALQSAGVSPTLFWCFGAAFFSWCCSVFVALWGCVVYYSAINNMPLPDPPVGSDPPLESLPEEPVPISKELEQLAPKYDVDNDEIQARGWTAPARAASASEPTH